jgi:hypothetical protein
MALFICGLGMVSVASRYALNKEKYICERFTV